MCCRNRLSRHTRSCGTTGFGRISPGRSSIAEGRGCEQRGRLLFNTTESQVGGSMNLPKSAIPAVSWLLFTATSFAQTSSIEGDVIGMDGKPMANLKCVVSDRKD